MIVLHGHLKKRTAENDNGVTATEKVDLTVLCEQYLDGQELDIDIVMSDGQSQYACISDNGPTLEPYFNETWGVCPSLLSAEDQTMMCNFAVDCTRALGFCTGVFHVECKLTSTGPQLVEVNARMGGGPIREMNRLTWGVDLVEETFFCSLGVPARPVMPPAPLTCIGWTFVIANRSGTLVSTQPIEDLKTREGVVSCDVLVKAGADVRGPEDGMPTWLCMVVVAKPTAQEAADFVNELEANVTVEIK